MLTIEDHPIQKTASMQGTYTLCGVFFLGGFVCFFFLFLLLLFFLSFFFLVGGGEGEFEVASSYLVDANQLRCW